MTAATKSDARWHDALDLLAAMELADMSSADVAWLAGVTERAVRQWMAGNRRPPALVLRVMRGVALGRLSAEALTKFPRIHPRAGRSP